MTTLKAARKLIVKEMYNNGTMSRINKRAEKHKACAIKMGYKNAQEAFNVLGKSFLEIANK